MWMNIYDSTVAKVQMDLCNIVTFVSYKLLLQQSTKQVSLFNKNK